jgi:hypothetical protein
MPRLKNGRPGSSQASQYFRVGRRTALERGRRALAGLDANQPAVALAGKRGRDAISDGDDSASLDTPPETAQTADDIDDDFDHVPKHPAAEEPPPATPASSASSASSFTLLSPLPL